VSDAELYVRWQEIMAEEWKKSRDGHQNERALRRLVDEQIAAERERTRLAANAYRVAHAPAPALTPEQEADVQRLIGLRLNATEDYIAGKLRGIQGKIAALESRRDPPEPTELREALEEWAVSEEELLVSPAEHRLYRAIRAESAARRAGKETP